LIQEKRFAYVILAARWLNYAGEKLTTESSQLPSGEKSRLAYEASLDRSISQIVATGATPVIIEQIAESSGDPHSCYYRHFKLRKKFADGACDFSRDDESVAERQNYWSLLVAKMKD